MDSGSARAVHRPDSCQPGGTRACTTGRHSEEIISTHRRMPIHGSCIRGKGNGKVFTPQAPYYRLSGLPCGPATCWSEASVRQENIVLGQSTAEAARFRERTLEAAVLELTAPHRCCGDPSKAPLQERVPRGLGGRLHMACRLDHRDTPGKSVVPTIHRTTGPCLRHFARHTGSASSPGAQH